MMVSSAVLGAAAGTGLFLVIAVTIVVYRYYTAERKVKNWSSLDRWPDPPKAPTCLIGPVGQAKVLKQQLISGPRNNHHHYNQSSSSQLPQRQHHQHQHQQQQQQHHYHHHHHHYQQQQNYKDDDRRELEASLVLDCCAKAQPCYYAVQNMEFNLSKEHHAVQPSASTDSGGQSSSRPSRCMGLMMGRTLTSLSRQASSSSGSQEQLPSDQQSASHQHHSGSSPQIRTYGPDGKHQNHHETLHAASSYPPSRGSRSPSPVRAASLDARTNPGPQLLLGTNQVGSGSLSSLACPSLLGSQSNINIGSNQTTSSSSSSYTLKSLSQQQQQQQQQLQQQQPPASPQPQTPQTSSSAGGGGGHTTGRCLSPLLIPPRASFSLGDGGSAPPASPLGSLQPDLYQRRDGPIFLGGNTRRSGKSLGQLHLWLSYDYDKSDLDVHLIEAQNLASNEQGGFNDPYIKLTLSPEVDARKRQTSNCNNDTNPRFDQHFKFPVSHEELQDKTLILQVIDYDRMSRNDMVGSVRVSLDELDLTSTMSPIEIWGEIGRERKPPEETQEVLISLSYLPSAQRLTLVIHKARNLFPAPGKDTLDPFVKVSLLCGERRVKKKKKTVVRKNTRSPTWDEAMSFNVPPSALSSSAIEICVVDSSSELIGNDAIVGSCIVGPGIGSPAGGYESGSNPGREHWLDMTNMPRTTTSMWHTLH